MFLRRSHLAEYVNEIKQKSLNQRSACLIKISFRSAIGLLHSHRSCIRVDKVPQSVRVKKEWTNLLLYQISITRTPKKDFHQGCQQSRHPRLPLYINL